MTSSKNLPYFIVCFGMFLVLKWAYTQSTTHDLYFLLWPTSTLVATITGSTAIYSPINGFYHPELNIYIDKSCAGFNLWILSFLLFSYLVIKYQARMVYKIPGMALSLMVAYLFTFLVNASRIMASLVVHQHTQILFPDQQPFFHEAAGIATNFTFLVVAYLILEKLFQLKCSHEKSA